jgi:hypothetical protein
MEFMRDAGKTDNSAYAVLFAEDRFPGGTKPDITTLAQTRKERVNALKTEWKKLWNERFDDHNRAESIATNDYATSFVNQVTIILRLQSSKVRGNLGTQ